MPHVRMYSRERCGLCDEARDIITRVRGRHPFEFEEVRIDGDDALERAYGLRIPVIEVDGEEWFETVVDPEQLARLVSGE